MGIQSLKKGLVYVGDFYRDDMTGYGMMVAYADRTIENCPGCTFFVGNWNDGVKTGIGTCYDVKGNIIYRGQFADNKPVQAYPSVDVDTSKQFSLLELSNGSTFIGETKDKEANGYGLIVFKDGDIWLTSFKNGLGNGIGLYMYASGEWATCNSKNGEYTIVSSSEHYKMLDAIKKQNVRDGINEALLGITSALEEFSAKMEQANAKNAIGQDEGNNTIDNIQAGGYQGNGGSYSGSSSGSSAGSTKCKHCQGSGKCSSISGTANKNYCHGSGKCSYCLGDGFNYAAGNPVKCTACNGYGKCKYCNGSGKCSECGGSGKK